MKNKSRHSLFAQQQRQRQWWIRVKKLRRATYSQLRKTNPGLRRSDSISEEQWQAASNAARAKLGFDESIPGPAEDCFKDVAERGRVPSVILEVFERDAKKWYEDGLVQVQSIHGSDLVDSIWYDRSRLIKARLRDGTSAVYNERGECLGDVPVLGERGYQVPPNRSLRVQNSSNKRNRS